MQSSKIYRKTLARPNYPLHTRVMSIMKNKHIHIVVLFHLLSTSESYKENWAD